MTESRKVYLNSAWIYLTEKKISYDIKGQARVTSGKII